MFHALAQLAHDRAQLDPHAAAAVRGARRIDFLSPLRELVEPADQRIGAKLRRRDDAFAQ
jgi:hypothetical protein